MIHASQETLQKAQGTLQSDFELAAPHGLVSGGVMCGRWPVHDTPDTPNSSDLCLSRARSGCDFEYTWVQAEVPLLSASDGGGHEPACDVDGADPSKAV